MIEAIIQQSNIGCRGTTIQETFDKACHALTKTSGHRISLLILENSHLLSQDLSIFGRWMTIQKCLNIFMSETKVILLGSEGKLDPMWLSCTRRAILPSSDEYNQYQQTQIADSNSTPFFEDASSTEATNSDFSSHSPRLSGTEQVWRNDLTWDSARTEFDSERLEAQTATGSAGFDAPAVYPSKKRNYSTFLQQNPYQYPSSHHESTMNHHIPHHKSLSYGNPSPFF